MIESREFLNQFSIELNCCAENDNDGIFMTIRRLKQFVSTLKEKIDQDNKEIISLDIIQNKLLLRSFTYICDPYTRRYYTE